MGAIKAIADAMHRNLENGTLQEDGCHALRNVAFHCGKLAVSPRMGFELWIHSLPSCACSLQSRT